MVTRYCDCEGWRGGWSQIESAQMLAWNHGSSYTGPVFKFCPWCGETLTETVESEDKKGN